MAINVEITNNPYIQRLQILINGEAASMYSNLEKFMDEPFCYWCDKILDAIFEECNGSSFKLSFRSREEELSIMEVLARKYPHCEQYTSLPLIRKDSLSQRMSVLSKMIKENKLTGYRKERRKALIIVAGNIGSLKKELQELEIKNIYCQVDVQVIDFADYLIEHPVGDVNFLVIKDKSIDECLEKINFRNGFVISFGEKSGFIEKRSGVFYYGATEENIFDVIFECFLLDPLMDVFCRCLKGLSQDIHSKFAEQIETLQSTSLKIIPEPENTTVEVGKSTAIRFRTDMDGYSANKEKLNFEYSNKGILLCNGMRVEGLREGECTLYVYREGEPRPCASVNYKVIKRNRITQLQLEENFVRIGVGDRQKLEYTFLPQDADNTDKINWETENAQVAMVDKSGNLTGVAVGVCSIWCTAEQISARCKVEVLPHLKRITADVDEIEMVYGESKELSYRIEPLECIDGSVIISSIDMRIVNVTGKILNAIGVGDTKIILQNRQETVRKEIVVHVRDKGKKIGKTKKKGFFSRLFG